MTDMVIQEGDGGSSPWPIILALVVLLIVGLLLLSTQVDVSSLDLSKHAQESHAGETWNAASIQTYMQSGKCVPQEYYCSNDTTIVYCQLDQNPKLAVGLIIGSTVRQVITGFAAPLKSWENRCP